MSAGEAKQVVASAFDAFAGGDASVFVGLLAPDVRYTLIGSTRVSGTFAGIAEVAARLLGPLEAALGGPLAIRAHRLTAEDDRVVVEATGRATLRSGAPYDQTYCFVFRVARGRIVEVVEHVDTQLVARAFDVPARREALLHRMDLNMWEMFREGSRYARGTDVLDADGLTLIRTPGGTFFHNSVMVREAVALDDVLARVAETHVARGLPYSIWTRAHADAALEAELRAAGFRAAVVMPAMALLGDPGTVPAADGLDVRAVASDVQRADFVRVAVESFGQLGTPPVVIEDADALGVPAVTWTGTDRYHGEFCFNLGNGGLAEEAAIMATWIRRSGYRTVGMIHELSPGGVEYASNFRWYAAREKLDVLIEAYTTQIPDDLEAVLRKIRDQKPDCLAYLGYGYPTILMGPMFRRLQWDPPRIMTTAFQFCYAKPEWMAALEGWVGVDQWCEANPLSQPVFDRFAARAGKRRDHTVTLLSYDTARLVAEGLARAPLLTPRGVKEGLERVRMLPAANGGPRTHMSLGPWDHKAYKGDWLVLRKIAGGRTVFVDLHDPANPAPPPR